MRNIEAILKNPKSFFCAPYFIAEIGVNHGGDINLAKKMILDAHQAGADCVKFQIYKASTLARKESPSYWDLTEEPTKSQHELFSNYDKLGFEDYSNLKNYCDDLGITFNATVFDFKQVKRYDSLLSFYKIASADLTNYLLLDEIARTGKPVVLSTGASSFEEITLAIHRLEASNSGQIILLHCVLNYPTPVDKAGLGRILLLKDQFPNKLIGYSDHTIPTINHDILITSALLGSILLEKHFTHDKSLKGNDHYHSFDKADLISYNDKLKELRKILKLNDLSEEQSARENARRSIVADGKINKGELFTLSNITVKRPGNGISPQYIDNIIGRRASKDYYDDDLIDEKI
jgi:sialic acid synthase SpsE